MPGDTVPGITDSAKLSTPVVAAGSVTTAQGEPAGDVPVVIRVWPASPSLAALPYGADVPTENVAVTVTDAAGAYQLRVDPSKPLVRFADANGYISFDVVAGVGAASTSFSFSKTIAELGAGGAAAQKTGPVQVSYADLILPGQPAAASPVSLGAAPAAVACSLQKLATIGNLWTVVGETYTHSGSTAKFTYTAGSSSTLGIGVSSGSGIFTASGSTTVTNTATIGFPTTPANSSRQWRTKFRYDRFTDLCGHTYARPTAFLGGAGTVFASSITATHCQPQIAGSSFSKSSTTASTLSTGVDSSSVIGIDLSARTGFTTTAKVKYTFAQSGRMCGSAGDPGTNPGRLAAKP